MKSDDLAEVERIIDSYSLTLDDPQFLTACAHDVYVALRGDEYEEEENDLRLSFSVNQQIATQIFSERIAAIRRAQQLGLTAKTEPSTK